jgi:hypothetical protein
MEEREGSGEERMRRAARDRSRIPVAGRCQVATGAIATCATSDLLFKHLHIATCATPDLLLKHLHKHLQYMSVDR